MSEPNQPVDLGRVVALHTNRPIYFDEPTGRHFSGDITGSIDVLLNNLNGESMLVRLPLGEKVLKFLAGKAIGNWVDIGPLEEERRAREAMASAPIGTATPPTFTGTNCPDCGELQYLCPSGTTCTNGHGY